MSSIPQIGAEKTQTLGLDANLAGLLCYVPFFPVNVGASILWLVTEPKQNTFVRFHAAQALTLCVTGVALWIVAVIAGTVLSIVLGMASSTLSALFSLLFLLVYLVLGFGLFGLSIAGMIKAYGGHMWEMPFIGQIARRFM